MVAQTLIVAAFALVEGEERPFVVTGQKAYALVELAGAGEAGLTALEAGTWAFRLASYVHLLRTENGLHIETVREEHSTASGGKGHHARYVLRSPVRIETETRVVS